MLIYPLRRYGGWAALASGITALLGIVSLMLFFTFELNDTQRVTRFHPFGFFSDFLPIFAALSALVVIAVLFWMERKDAPQLSAVAALLGGAGHVILAVSGILFVFEKITLDDQIQWFFISLAPLGLWQILVNYLAQRHGLLPSRLTWFGILVGVGQLVHFVVFFLLDGYNTMVSSSPEVILTNYPLLIVLAVSTLISLMGYIGAPIWAIWLGRVLVHNDYRSEPVSPRPI